MARPRKSDVPDLSIPCDLTMGAIERLACPADRAQAFLRDAKGNGLRVRVTPSGKKTFVWEQSFKNSTIRRTIGEVSAWSIEAARAEAKRLSAMLDARTDPRELEREREEEKAAAKAHAEAQVAETASKESVLQNPRSPHEHWLSRVNANGQNSQEWLQYRLVSGSFEGLVFDDHHRLLPRAA